MRIFASRASVACQRFFANSPQPEQFVVQTTSLTCWCSFSCSHPSLHSLFFLLVGGWCFFCFSLQLWFWWWSFHSSAGVLVQCRPCSTSELMMYNAVVHFHGRIVTIAVQIHVCKEFANTPHLRIHCSTNHHLYSFSIHTTIATLCHFSFEGRWVFNYFVRVNFVVQPFCLHHFTLAMYMIGLHAVL